MTDEENRRLPTKLIQRIERCSMSSELSIAVARTIIRAQDVVTEAVISSYEDVYREGA